MDSSSDKVYRENINQGLKKLIDMMPKKDQKLLRQIFLPLMKNALPTMPLNDSSESVALSIGSIIKLKDELDRLAIGERTISSRHQDYAGAYFRFVVFILDKIDEDIGLSPKEKLMTFYGIKESLTKLEEFENSQVDIMSSSKSKLKRLIRKWSRINKENVDILKHLEASLAYDDSHKFDFYLHCRLSEKQLKKLSQSLHKRCTKGEFDFYNAIDQQQPIEITGSPETIAWLIHQLRVKGHLNRADVRGLNTDPNTVIEVFDVSGALVERQVLVNSETTQLDLRSFNSGCYYLKMIDQTNAKVQTRILVKQ
jgi:hypothetical protein